MKTLLPAHIIERFTETLIFHSAPTLAGHKVASLFCFHEFPVDILLPALEPLLETLKCKGIHVKLLCRCEKASQVYLYRPALLKHSLQQIETREFLENIGYHSLDDVDSVLEQLYHRFRERDHFPHELGIFLGYPLEDVRGFIEHKGKHYLCKGYWKVYAHVEKARELFQLYEQCRKHCLRRYREGKPLSIITVAA